MTPIIFPYTYLDAYQYRLLGSLFGPLTLYQPAEDQVPEALRRWADQGGLTLRIPVKGRESELARCMAEYSAWAAQRQGRHGLDSEFIQHLERKVPFFEESAVTRLKSAIRGGAAADGKAVGPRGASAEDRLFQARLFLAMAQAYDRQQWLLSQELANCGQREQAMLKDLQGVAPDPVDSAAAAALPGAVSADLYQAGPRLRAWLRLWLADKNRGEASEMLITSHLQSVEGLEAMLPDLTWIVTLESLPAHLPGPARQALLLSWMAQLAGAVGDPPSWASPPSELNSGPGGLPVKLEVYAAPHQLWSGFAPFAEPDAASAAPGGRQTAVRHGIVVRVSTTA